MRYLPIHVDTSGQIIIIVGAQAAAEAKLRTLLKTNATLHVYADVGGAGIIGDEVLRWAEQGRVTLIRRSVTDDEIKKARLLYAATEDDVVNAELAKRGDTLGVLVNAADQKDACDFITPALVDRSPVTISIGTEGKSPSLGRAIKTDLEARLPSTLGNLTLKINELRSKVKAILPSLSDRQRFWANIFGTNDLEAQLRLSETGLEAQVDKNLKGFGREIETDKQGLVVLVGGGPGNPDLLTLAARQKLHSADVIVYDRLISQGVLDFGRREAEYIYVGKEPGGVSKPQSDINDILIKKAKEGLLVVRLKSGDPLIFGRADEELDALSHAGLSYEIIPGITAAASAAAQIGASLTRRGTNKSVTLMTGHDAKGFAEHDWKTLAKHGGRAAIYMGVGASRFIQGRLLLHDAQASKPVTIVENASRDNQIIIASTLGNLANDIEAHGIKGPAILLVGYTPRKAMPVLSERLEAAQ